MTSVALFFMVIQMIRHAFCSWCHDPAPLETQAEMAVKLGYHGIDLLHPHQARTIAQYGLTCPVSAAPEHESGLGGIEKAFNCSEHHATLFEIYENLIPKAAAEGIKNVIVFSGNRDGLDDQSGLENCARGLAPLLPLAEKNGITLVMEMLNSKVDHPDYQADKTDWAVALCDLLDAPQFKLLYDIYHMQIMEGDIIATIRKHHRHIAHYHTGGCPGRNEIDATQELQYPAIVSAIAETGYEGFLAQEFVPKGDPEKALANALKSCTI